MYQITTFTRDEFDVNHNNWRDSGSTTTVWDSLWIWYSTDYSLPPHCSNLWLHSSRSHCGGGSEVLHRRVAREQRRSNSPWLQWYNFGTTSECDNDASSLLQHFMASTFHMLPIDNLPSTSLAQNKSLNPYGHVLCTEELKNSAATPCLSRDWSCHNVIAHLNVMNITQTFIVL